MCINVSGARGFVCQRFRQRSIHPSIHPSIHFVNHLNYDFIIYWKFGEKLGTVWFVILQRLNMACGILNAQYVIFYFFFATSLSIKANKTEDVV